MEPEVKKDRTESESESSNDGICCGVENRALVEDLETIEPESETDSEHSRYKGRCGVECRALSDSYFRS